MGEAARSSRRSLERLAAAGLELHLQVVLCPGWNDGAVLDETVAQDGRTRAVADLGIVPVSLAVEGDLRRVTAADAAAVLRRRCASWQARKLEASRRRLRPRRRRVPPASRRVPSGQRRPRPVRERHRHGRGTACGGRGAAARGPRAGRRARALRDARRHRSSTEPPSLRLRSGAPLRPFAVDEPALRRACDGHGPAGRRGGRSTRCAPRHWQTASGCWRRATSCPAELGRTLDDVGEDELAAACGGRLVLASPSRRGLLECAR